MAAWGIKEARGICLNPRGTALILAASAWLHHDEDLTSVSLRS